MNIALCEILQLMKAGNLSLKKYVMYYTYLLLNTQTHIMKLCRKGFRNCSFTLKPLKLNFIPQVLNVFMGEKDPPARQTPGK